jgi:hypothetical protein
MESMHFMHGNLSRWAGLEVRLRLELSYPSDGIDSLRDWNLLPQCGIGSYPSAGTLKASGKLRVVNPQTFSRNERYSSTDMPITFMLFLILNTGTSLYLGITTGRFAPG